VRVLVDTSVWSLALRRRAAVRDTAVETLRTLIDEGRVAIIGPIRQELLSGIRDAATFERLRHHLSAFPDEPLDTADFERAAEHFNMCRAQGIQGSNADFLICASAERRSLPVLTTDLDFRRYAGILPIVLHGQ